MAFSFPHSNTRIRTSHKTCVNLRCSLVAGERNGERVLTLMMYINYNLAERGKNAPGKHITTTILYNHTGNKRTPLARSYGLQITGDGRHIIDTSGKQQPSGVFGGRVTQEQKKNPIETRCQLNAQLIIENGEVLDSCCSVPQLIPKRLSIDAGTK